MSCATQNHHSTVLTSSLTHAIDDAVDAPEPPSSILKVVVFSLVVLALSNTVVAQHVHQLNYNNSSWSDTDLTAASITGGPQPAPSGIAGFYTTPNDDLHVFYFSFNDGHVHQLSYKFYGFPLYTWLWADEDDTASTGGVPAPSFGASPISGFAIGNVQYVYFCAADGNIHEYSYGDGGNWSWVDRDLNVLAGAGSSANCADNALSNSLIAFSTPNGQRHVFYQPYTGANHIYQFVGPSWYVEDETIKTAGAKGDGTPMAGFAIGNAQYVLFEDTNSNAHMYSYGLGGIWNWLDTNLRAKANGVKSDKADFVGVAAFNVPHSSRMEVYYDAVAGGSQQVHEMTFLNNHWSDQAIPFYQSPSYQTQMVGFATTPNNQFHLYFPSFLGGGVGIYQLYFNGSSWSNQKLSSNGAIQGGVSGFSIGNLQYVYYMGD